MEGRSRVGLTALLAVPLAGLSLASAGGSLLAPHLLVANPLLLMALSPRAIYLAVAAASVPLPVFLAVGLLRLGAADPWHYALGRMHGPVVAARLARRSPMAGRLARRLLEIGWRKGLAAVALSPTGKVLMIAGASRLRPGRVALADVCGTLVQLTVLYATGRPLAQALSPSPLTLAIVAVVVTLCAVAGPAIFAALTRRSRAPAVDEPATPTPTPLSPRRCAETYPAWTGLADPDRRTDSVSPVIRRSALSPAAPAQARGFDPCRG